MNLRHEIEGKTYETTPIDKGMPLIERFVKKWHRSHGGRISARFSFSFARSITLASGRIRA